MTDLPCGHLDGATANGSVVVRSASDRVIGMVELTGAGRTNAADTDGGVDSLALESRRAAIGAVATHDGRGRVRFETFERQWFALNDLAGAMRWVLDPTPPAGITVGDPRWWWQPGERRLSRVVAQAGGLTLAVGLKEVADDDDGARGWPTTGGRRLISSGLIILLDGGGRVLGIMQQMGHHIGGTLKGLPPLPRGRTLIDLIEHSLGRLNPGASYHRRLSDRALVERFTTAVERAGCAIDDDVSRIAEALVAFEDEPGGAPVASALPELETESDGARLRIQAVLNAPPQGIGDTVLRHRGIELARATSLEEARRITAALHSGMNDFAIRALAVVDSDDRVVALDRAGVPTDRTIDRELGAVVECARSRLSAAGFPAAYGACRNA